MIDLAYGFTDPDLPLGTDLDFVASRTRDVLDDARRLGVPVFFTVLGFAEGDHRGSAWRAKIPALESLRLGTRATELDARLHRRDDEPVIVKHGASAFTHTGLEAMLTWSHIDTLVLTGASTSGCVRATAVDGCMAGYRILVPSDCVGDRDHAAHDANLHDIDEKYGDVVKTTDVLELFERVLPNGGPADRSGPSAERSLSDRSRASDRGALASHGTSR